MKHLAVKAMTKSVRKLDAWWEIRERDRAALAGLKERGERVDCESWCREVGRLLGEENGKN